MAKNFKIASGMHVFTVESKRYIPNGLGGYEMVLVGYGHTFTLPVNAVNLKRIRWQNKLPKSHNLVGAKVTVKLGVDADRKIVQLLGWTDELKGSFEAVEVAPV